MLVKCRISTDIFQFLLFSLLYLSLSARMEFLCFDGLFAVAIETTIIAEGFTFFNGIFLGGWYPKGLYAKRMV